MSNSFKEAIKSGINKGVEHTSQLGKSASEAANTVGRITTDEGCVADHSPRLRWRRPATIEEAFQTMKPGQYQKFRAGLESVLRGFRRLLG